ncbi:MAG TPA: Ig-like domain-containing protein, partial [Candidatus Baltobacteraceae bacterium]|nr:Ig-like domain-containing protein [Candidatus Baltobacteraceae bacterium]
MEPWGVDQKSTEEAVELSQGEVSPSGGVWIGANLGRKTRVALFVAGALVLMVGGTLHNWRKKAAPNVSGKTQSMEQGALEEFAGKLLKGTSLLGGLGGDSAKKLAANKTAKMSGAPLSLPLFFEANRGQTDPQVKFLARSGGYSLFVTPTEAVFAGAHTRAPRGALSPRKGAPTNPGERAVLRMKLLESNPGPEISGIKELPGKVNYLIGNNPKDWHTGIPLYEEVRSREVYPGIGLVYHGDQQRLEYDFQVAPGADPGRIRFKVTGAEKIAVDEKGDLVLHTGKNEFRMRKPVIYQPEGEQRRPVDGGFLLQAGKLVAFHVGAYDKKMPLVIDPTIVFASFLGAAGQELPAGMDLDTTNPSALKLYLSGSTTDVTTFTETNTKLGNTPGAGAYAFVAKIDPTTTGSASLDFLTFIGGNLIFSGGTGPCSNVATDLKLDLSGGAGQVEAVLLGDTNCRDFPVTVGGPTTGTDDLFITRLTPSGAAIDGSTFFGGNGSAGLAYGGGASLFVNPEGSIVVSGDTTSTNFATTANAYSVSFNNGTPGEFDDCFIAKVDRSFNVLYLTYMNVGGNSASGTPAGCGVGSVDPVGKIYFGGNIYSATAFNLANGGTGANGFQKTFVGTPGTTPNAFVGVLDPSLSGLNQLTYSSYIAGGGGTTVQAGAIDVTHGIAALVGTTISNSTTNAPDIPLLNAIQSTNNSPAGVGTGWITVIDTTKTGAASLVASSYLGGSTGGGSSSIRSVAIDAVPGNSPTQRIVVGGQTTATNFPTMNPLQTSLVGSQNAFVSVLSVPSPGNTFNMSLLFSTYLGGGVAVSGQSDSVRNLITDSNHQIYALGRTASANFFGNTVPATTVNGFQPTCASCGGGTPQADLAIFVLAPQSGTNVPDLTVSKSHSGSFSQGQSGAQFSITVTNSGTGSTVGTVSLADSLPSSMTATAMTGTGWTCSIGTLVCTRADGLGAGLSYPVITLTVNVASNAPPSVTNTVVVSGGSETNTANDTASDTVAITSSVGACTNNYTGLTNGSWGTATNWSTGAVPVNTDVVCIPSSITVLVNTGLSAANQTISGLNNLGTITFSAGPLTVTNNSVANNINMSGGTLAFNGQLTVSGTFAQSGGTFAGTGEVDLNGPFTWSGGTICSALTGASCTTGTVAKLNANGGITFPASANVVLSSRTMNNNGTATWSGANGSLDMVNSAVINNGVGSVWNITNDSSLVFGGGATVAFNNAGTFEKTGGTGTSTVSAPFHNTGTVLGNATIFSFTGGGNCGSSCSGTYTSGPSGTIAFAGGIFAQSGPLAGQGTLNFNGATMDFGTGVTMLSTTNINISSGTLAGAAPGVLDFETTPNWSGGTICSSLSGASCVVGNNGTMNANAGINFPASASVLLSDRTLNNNGTVTWSGTAGSLDAVNGAVINNPANGVWNYVNDSSLVFGGGATSAFNNAGKFEKTGGTGTSTISVNFNNTGTVLGNSATMAFTGGGNCGSTCGGSYTPNTVGSINFAGGIFGQSGPINGTGTVNFNGATMNFGTGTATISTTNVNLISGTLAGAAPGILNFATQLNWTGGTMCSLLSGTSCVVGTNATTNANAGINFPASANVLLSNRTLNNNGTATWSGAAGSIDVVNGAIISNPLNSVWNYANDSTLAFGGGTAAAFNNGGTFEKTGGTGSSSISISFNNTGMVLGNSTTLSFTGGGNCGSTCSGTYMAGAGAAINFAANIFAQSGPITGAGTVNFNGATMDFGTGTVTISATTVNMTAGTLGGAAPGIVNFSTALNWTGGTMCSILSGTACVTGTNATTNMNAGINFPTSANVLLSSRTLNNNGTATWSGTGGSLDMVNGSIVNNGASSVWNYTNDSSVVFGGGAAVAFNNAGNFEKTGGTGTSTVSTPFNNSGNVNGNSGTISLSAGGNCGSTCPGTFATATGGTLSFLGGSYLASGPFNGAGTMNFSGATMTLTGTYGATGTTNVSAGTVNFNEASPVTIAGPVNFSGGTITGSTSTLNLPGLFTWSGGSLSLPGTTNATGGIALPNAGSVVLSNGTLNTPAAVTFAAGGSGGSFLQSTGSIVNNTGTWNLQGDDFVSYNGGTATVFNNNAGGIFEKTGGTTSSQIGTAFNNNGTVTVGNTSGAASLVFSSGLCNTTTPCVGNGSWTALAGYTLAFNSGVYNLSGPFGGAGTMNFAGALMNLTGTYGLTGATNVPGGTVNFNEASPVTIAGPLNLTGGTVAGSTSTLNLPGLFTWTAGTLALPGTTNATGGIALPNAGAVILNGGTLNTPAAVTFAPGGSGSSFLLSNGAVVNNTGTWNLQGDDFVTYNGGTATAFNNKVGGIFEKTGGTTTSQVSTPFNNTGTVTVGAVTGSFTLNFNASTCTTAIPCTGTGSWNPSSGFTVAFSGGTYNLSGSLSGAGNYLFGGATANLTGPYTATGATTVSGGAVNFNEASPVTIAGPLNFSSGTIAGTTSALNLPGLFTWTAGTLALPQTTNAAGGIAFPNIGNMILNLGTLNTSGAVTFAAGGPGSSFLLQNGAIVNNTGTWNLQGDEFVTYNGGTATRFNNISGGIFEKTGGTTTSQVSTAFSNSGTVLANALNLFFSASFTQIAGTTMLGGGSLQTASTNPLTFQGGSLTGSGTVQGDVTNTGGSVAPGSSTAAGAITISGSTVGIYSQSATGAYNVKIGGTTAGQFDTLAMSGAATLGGPLNVSLLNSFSPALGNTFTILTAASVAGTFSTTNFPALSAGLGWHVTYNATNVVLSVVSVSSPVANLNPGSVTFPNTIVNSVAAIQKVQLQNTGTSALTITSIVPTGTDAANYSYTPDAVQPCPISPATLANGASCLLDIGFLPLTAGTHNNAQITVTDNSGNVVGSTQTVSLSGTGIVLNSIAVTPATVTVPQGGTQQFTATGTYSDSSTQNLTSQVTWASATTSVGTINAAGVAQAVAPGTSNITAKQGSVTSPAAVLTVTGATHFTVSSPVNAIAGTSFSVTIFAEDQFNTVVPGYTGTVHFTSTDPLAILPANSTLTNGSGNFQVTLKTIGSQTYTATDTVTSSITGTSNPVTVGSGLATHFQVTVPGIATVGVATSVNVVALDQFNNAVTTYAGTVHFTSSDASAILPANTTLTSGAGTFPVTFKTAGSQTVTATDTVTATITGTSNADLVSTGTATHLALVTLPSVTAGVPLTVVVEALDQFNNIVTNYSGTVHFTSTDAAAVLPANSTLTNGVGSFQATLKTTGSQTITGTDTITATITGTSSAITVSSTTATHFVVSAPPSAAAGTAVSVTVGAFDQFNNLVTGYTGTVHITSTDAAAILPANSTLTSGVGVFQVTLKTAGNQTVTATDTVTATINGTSNTITVGSSVATHLLISAPGAATAGTPFNIIVTALDQFSNIATGYTGTVHFTSTDGAAVLPANVTLINGTNTLSVTLKTLGSQTITGTDTITATITGTSNVVSVSSGIATHFVVSAPGVATAGTAISVSVTALDSFNNIATGYTGTVHFTSTDATAVLPANTTLASGTGSFPVTLKSAGLRTVTATDTVTGTITGTTGTITVSSAPATHLVVTAPAVATAGTFITVHITAVDQFNNAVPSYTGTVHFTSSDGAAVLPANSTLSVGIGAFSVTLNTTGSQTVTATDTVTGTITGTTGTITVSSATTTHLLVTAPAAATAGTPVTVNVTALDQFNNTVTSYPGTVHFTSSDVLAVLPANSTLTNGAGTFQVTLKSTGSQSVTATDFGNATITGTSGPISVTAVLQTITVAPASASVATGLTQPFTATGHFSDGTSGPVSVNWSSANTAIATINSSGVATGVGAGGPITITATSTTNAAISGTAQLTVTAAVLQSISVLPANPTIAKGLTQQFTAMGTFSNSSVVDITSQVAWFSATTSVATINSTGLATAVGTGTSNITASLLGVTSPIDVLTVTGPALQSLVVVPTAPIVAVGGTQQLNAEGVFSDGTSLDQTPNVTWLSSNTTQATITTGGLLSALQQGGLVTVTATSTSNPAIKGMASLTVAVPIGFALTGSMSAPRDIPDATVLTDGRVLITGGVNFTGVTVLSTAEIYDQATGTFSPTGSMTVARFEHTTTLLPDGRVLIVGGTQSDLGQPTLASAEIYSPANGTFTATGNMANTRRSHTATLLNNGTVLVTGGTDSSGHALASAELFDPKSGTFALTGSMTTPRQGHTATLLGDGTVLVAGAGTAEIYSPASGTFTTVSSMAVARSGHTATLLNDGTVLMAGGFDSLVNSLSSAELYNPVTKTFVLSGSMASSRGVHTATILNNGTVLFIGGYIVTQTPLAFSVLPTAELYDPVAKTFSGTGSLNFARDAHAAVRLTNGKVLVTGGDNEQCDGIVPSVTWCVGAPLASAELYMPSTFTQPGLTSIAVTPTTPSIATGGFQQFTATGTFSGGGPQTLASVTWSSSNTADVSITNDVTDSGRAFGLAPGSVTITACEGAVCGSTGVTVPATLVSISVSPTAAGVAAGGTVPFGATGHFSDGTTGAVSVNWSSSNTAIATINSSGVATGVAAGGPVTIRATSTANAAISGTALLTVSAAGPTLQTISVTPANPTIATNAIQAFIAIGHFSDGTSQNLTSTVTWGSATTAVATINAAGVATGVSAGTSTISATLGAVSGSTVLTVSATTAHAYVGDSVSATCCLDVIDITTNQIVKQIPITTINEPLGITPDQSRVYVPDNAGSVLDVIDTTTNTLVNTIPVGNGTTAVVINPNGKFGYVSDLNDGNVVVFNVATSAVVATVPIGFSAGWISITPDGALVYAASDSDGRVAVINTSTNTLSTTITLNAPVGQPAVGCVSGPTFNPEGTLGYFSLLCSGNTFNGNTINVLSIPSNTLVAQITVGTGPFQSAISPDGSRLYSANAVANTVSVINTATNAVIATVPMPGHSQSIAVTPDGAHVYVASSNAATVSVIQTSTNTVSASIPATVPFGIVIASPPAASAATTLT